MIRPDHFRNYVIRPTLELLEGMAGVPWSMAAENLLLGTALAESKLTALRQIGGGPALGVYQIEPATHRDVWANYLRGELRQALNRVASARPRVDAAAPHDFETLVNLEYATAVARVIYRRARPALPDANDAEGLARYHEVYFNTRLGAVGKTRDVLEKLEDFRSVVAGGRHGA